MSNFIEHRGGLLFRDGGRLEDLVGDHTQYVLVDGTRAMTGGLEVDTIGETTADAGVTIDGVGLKDGDVSATNVDATVVYKVGGIQVVGAQGAAVADATDAASAITQLNELLARCRAHGLIA